MMSKLNLPSDHLQRAEALNTAISCIVQAPAGSGKTELLTQRFLKLLAEVDEPHEILAITFTRAATAEMRSRILQQLEKARAEKYDPALETARKALAHSEKRGWRLLEQPQALNIQTIDSLCLRIAYEQPLLAQMGGHMQPQDDTRPLYDEAARRTLANLGGPGKDIHEALMHLLARRDNNLAEAQRLIAEMLASRDQWLHIFPLGQQWSEEDWHVTRLQLEVPFKSAVQRVLEQAHSLLSQSPLIAAELLELGRYACEHGGDFALLAELKDLPHAGLVEHWQCLAKFLTTDKAWRKKYSRTQGFPADLEKHLPENQRPSRRMQAIIQHLRSLPDLLSVLNEIPNLPPPRYTEDQWNTLRKLFIVLRYAVAELRVLFAERNIIDFVEIGVAALQVLETPNENVLRFGEQIRHLLVDEFQDTSRHQLRLLQLLLRAWTGDERRTCFLVGDPMQSIYMFRQAEVELFEQVKRHGIEYHPFQPVYLSANFRSHAGLVNPLNAWFQKIFVSDRSPDAAVSFAPSEAVTPAQPVDAVYLHTQFVARGDATGEKRAVEHEAEEVLRIVQDCLPRIRQAETDPDASFTVAVLARAREHLSPIAKLLRKNDIPFRAVEVERLGQQQEIRDLVSLTRALLHPMDRIAWLSVLRAPWCGLMLPDLHLLCGEDNKNLSHISVQKLIEERQQLLSHDGQQRLQRVSQILRHALENRYQQGQSLSTWIERTWHTLGGPLCLDAAQRENARVFFSMLDGISPDGIACLGDELDRQLERLFAQPDPRASERAGVQLMTIHKAKGLGFDVVIVPGLERMARGDSNPLIVMLQRPDPANSEKDELLIAPLGSRDSDIPPVYRWVQQQRDKREQEELKRVLYVACTRARRELHLFGTATITKDGRLAECKNTSLLYAAWPALEANFLADFEAKKRQNVIMFPSAAEPGVVSSLAAVAESNRGHILMKRLPASGALPEHSTNISVPVAFEPEFHALFERPDAGRLQRLTGSITHALLDRLSRSQLPFGADAARWVERYASVMLRTTALPEIQKAHALSEITASVISALEDPQGQWLLAQHLDAQSEASWTGWIEGALRTVRADRVFRAGSTPLSAGKDHIWVVDYKTTPYSGTNIAGFLSAQREQYAPQLALYGKALQKIHGNHIQLRLALYFPRLKRLEHWSF